MPSNSAEYQRAYRARQRAKRAEVAEPADPTVARLRARILELEEDVRHLKAELAKRPIVGSAPSAPPPLRRQFNSRPFRPVPKT
jgi:hypothetical protein